MTIFVILMLRLLIMNMEMDILIIIELLIHISPVTRTLKKELQVSNKECDKMNKIRFQEQVSIMLEFSM